MSYDHEKYLDGSGVLIRVPYMTWGCIVAAEADGRFPKSISPNGPGTFPRLWLKVEIENWLATNDPRDHVKPLPPLSEMKF